LAIADTEYEIGGGPRPLWALLPRSDRPHCITSVGREIDERALKLALVGVYVPRSTGKNSLKQTNPRERMLGETLRLPVCPGNVQK
jgi:hypothetical protein